MKYLVKKDKGTTKMSKRFSKLAFGVSTISLIGFSFFSFAPSALAKGNNSKDPVLKTTTCNVTNISIGNIAATACKGPFDGNDTGAGNPLLTELNKGLFDVGSNVTWSLAGKSDSNENNIFGFEAQNDFRTGQWSLDKAIDSNNNGLSTKFNKFVALLSLSKLYQ